jgi:hypothetical protein
MNLISHANSARETDDGLVGRTAADVLAHMSEVRRDPTLDAR